MKTKDFLLLFTLVVPLFGATAAAPKTTSYMSDKTEVSVDLEVSGAEALCQTSNGYVWIAQYSGLTRYDSKEYVTYKSFTENGKEYPIINVRALAAKDDTLYIATYKNIFVYEDFHFSYVNVKAGTIKNLVLDEANDLLYISSADEGATIYDIKSKKSSKVPGLETGNVNDITLDTVRNTYYYHLDTGVYDSQGNPIHLYPRIYDLYSYQNTLYIGEDTGVVKRYDMSSRTFLSDINIPDQVNKLLYSEKDQTLFAACETNGLYCVNLAGDEPVISLAGDLQNKNQLVDLMIDYEGNLWIASHYIGGSGVSIITKNALSELLYDDATWKSLVEDNRGIYAVEKFGDILYIMSAKSIYLYDVKENRILPDNVVMNTINDYATANGIVSFSPRDVEMYNNKIYFVVNGIGIVEYNPTSDNVVIYDPNYINAHLEKAVEIDGITPSANRSVRSLRSFDNYLAIGYNRGIMKFDGTNFSLMYVDSNVLYINKSKEGKLLFNKTQGIFEVKDDFSGMEQIPTTEDATGNILKFLVDGDYIYYTMNSRLFQMQKVNGKYVSREIIVPYVKGSLVELSKVELNNKNNNVVYKYVIASQTQIYITDELNVEQLSDYEFYDSSNGLRPIAANTSGYYDREDQSYYFQSTDGIFVYSFNETKAASVPVKICT